MKDKKYIRKAQCSVTVFLHRGNDYLFLHRGPNKRVDADKLNGIGGRLEPGENYLAAAIRETEEETGFKVSPKDMQLAGVVKTEGGYDEDWVMCFFRAEVSSKKIPRPKKQDGELIWINKNEVLDNEYELVDDLNYCFKEIVSGGPIFFMTAKVDKHEKIYKVSMNKLA